jgi:hypothetical protein
MENLREKSKRETQSTMDGHSSRWEQAEDIMSELEDGIKRKNWRAISQTT